MLKSRNEKLFFLIVIVSVGVLLFKKIISEGDGLGTLAFILFGGLALVVGLTMLPMIVFIELPFVKKITRWGWLKTFGVTCIINVGSSILLTIFVVSMMFMPLMDRVMYRVVDLLLAPYGSLMSR